MEEINLNDIRQTRELLINFFNEAEEKDIQRLRQNPIRTLKDFGVKLLFRITPRRLARLSNSIRGLINRIGNAFKNYRSCMACKIALKIIFFAIASVLNMAVSAIFPQIDLTNILSVFFNESIETVEPILTKIGLPYLQLQFFELNGFIERLCIEFGYCS